MLTLCATDAIGQVDRAFSETLVSDASLVRAFQAARRGRFLFSKLFLIALFGNAANSTGFENNSSAVRPPEFARVLDDVLPPETTWWSVETRLVRPIAYAAQGQNG